MNSFIVFLASSISANTQNSLSNILSNKLLFFLTFLFIFIFSTPFQKWLTYLHEYGHNFSLFLIAKRLGIKPKKSTIYIEKQLFTFHYGITLNPLYEYLQKEQKYKYIRFSTISGCLFLSFIYACIIIILYLAFNPIYVIYPMTLLALELLFFFKDSDFFYFRFPELFDYALIRETYLKKETLKKEIQTLELEITKISNQSIIEREEKVPQLKETRKILKIMKRQQKKNYKTYKSYNKKVQESKRIKHTAKCVLFNFKANYDLLFTFLNYYFNNNFVHYLLC